MIRHGIFTRQQYAALSQAERRRSGGNVSFQLLETATPPGRQEILDFEDISFTLRMSNKTFRTTFRNRFDALNVEINGILGERFASDAGLRAEDRAVSHGLTSWEWALALQGKFPNVELVASDLLLYLLEVRLGDGAVYICEPDGTPLQYIKEPFAVSIADPPGWRTPVNRWVSAQARRRFAGLGLPKGWTEAGASGVGGGIRVRRISYIHPEARAFSEAGRTLRFVADSVFSVPAAPCHVVRTMNILNLSYFTPERLREAAVAIGSNMAPGGIWIVGRTMEDNFVNHVSIFERTPAGWGLVRRIERGSEIEELILTTPVKGQ